MLSSEENALFTQVGPSTKMGEVLRRYWHPVGVSESLTSNPQRIRLLGEDLVLYRTTTGAALMELRCAHRRVALDFGRVEGDCIRCPYHGWLYDSNGQCLEQPAEPEGSSFKEKVRQKAYLVEEAGGLIFAYLGPAPAPLLPLYDTLLFEDGVKIVQLDTIEANWFQLVENIPDLAHLPWLHAGSFHVVTGRKITYNWEPTDYGFDNVMHIDGVDDIHRSCYSFPYTNRFTVRPEKPGGPPQHSLMFRVPTDDVTTAIFLVRTYPSAEREFRVKHKGSIRGIYQPDVTAWWGISPNDQDRMAVEQQDFICDRPSEHLAASDAGILKMRGMMRNALAAVAAGEDPPYLIRDPAKQALEYRAADTSLSVGHREFAYTKGATA
jgi:5,5'-dehydrodivanillate O-demethylase